MEFWNLESILSEIYRVYPDNNQPLAWNKLEGHGRGEKPRIIGKMVHFEVNPKGNEPAQKKIPGLKGKPHIEQLFHEKARLLLRREISSQTL